MYKNCLNCDEKFYFKNTYSKKYWDIKKFCSRSCSRSVTGRKPKPNDFIEHEDYIELLIISKNKVYKSKIDKEYYSIEDIKNYIWSMTFDKRYLSRRLNSTDGLIGLHNIIMPKKDGYVVDHINGNSLDNRKINLRYLSFANNIRNQKKKIYKYSAPGISKIKEKYKVILSQQKIGVFDTLDLAIKARIEAEKHNWGISFTEERLFMV
jgi:hypothetical protein